MTTQRLPQVIVSLNAIAAGHQACAMFSAMQSVSAMLKITDKMHTYIVTKHQTSSSSYVLLSVLFMIMLYCSSEYVPLYLANY